MKKRTLFLTIALCFLFCISVFVSERFLADDDPEIYDVKLYVKNYEFFNKLQYGMNVDDISNLADYVHFSFKWSAYGGGSWSSEDYPNLLCTRNYIYDANNYEIPFAVSDSQEFDHYFDGRNILNLSEYTIRLFPSEDKTMNDACFPTAKQIQPPIRQGYKFDGYWTSGSAGNEIFDSAGYKLIQGNIQNKTLYAHWIKSYDIKAQNTDCEYDGNTKSINRVTGVDAPPDSVKYYYNGVESWSTDTPFKDIGTYVIPYEVYEVPNKVRVVKSGTITLNIHGSKKSMFMGVSSISKFDSTTCTYDYIWFGNHKFGNGTNILSPIKFRVLDNQTKDDYSKSGLFLLSEYTLGNSCIYKQDNGAYFSYCTSYLRNLISDFELKDGEGKYVNVFRSAFNDLERGQIIKTNRTEVEVKDSYPFTYLNGDQLFLINFETDDYFLYGDVFGKNNISTRGSSNDYYLSTMLVSGMAVPVPHLYGVLSDGKSTILNATQSRGIRPAMNLKVDDVAFSSTTATKAADNTMVPGAKAMAIVSDPQTPNMKKIEEDTKNTFNSFKLTLFDKDHLKLTKENYDPGPDPENWQTLQIKDIKKDNTIPIEGLTASNTSEGNGLKNNDYISAIITKPSGEIMYYGRLKAASSVGTNGAVSLEIPYNVLPNNQGVDTIDNGDYYIKLFLEEYNGGDTDANETDTCSDFLNFKLEVRTMIDFAQESNVDVTYNGLGQTIASPSLEINANYVDVEYNLDGKTDENGEKVWSKDKPYVTDVKYADTDPNHGPERAKSEVLSYDIKVRVKVKDIYKDHPLLKYYEDGEKDVYLKINPANLDYSAQGVYKTYDGLESHIEITPYINGAPYQIGYNLDGGENYSEKNLVFKNVNDTATIDDQGNITAYSKDVYFEILACNYEVTHGRSTANIQPVHQSLQVQNVDTPYDSAPHTFNILNYFPSADKLNITYTYIDDNGIQHTDDLNKPEFTKAGEHDVYINLQEKDENGNPPKTSNNYFSMKNAKATVTIREANIVYQVEGTEVEYDGEPHTINLFLSYPSISGEGVEVLYSTDNINWQKDKPEFTEANVNDKKNGDTVYYKISAPNYKTVEGSKKVFITKSKVICSESQQLDVLYDGGQHAASIYLSKPTSDKATVLYSKDNGATYTETEPPRHRDVGAYKQYFKVEAGNNYEEYYGSKTLTISPRSIKKAVIETISHRAYTGRPITPSIIITDGTPSIISESDYVVSYSNNVDKGEAKATITGINNYNEQVTETFYITDPDGNSPDDNGGETGADSINESSSGGSADLTGMAGSANSLLTGEDIRPLYFLIVVFILNVCAAIIIYRYKGKRVGD